MTRKLVPLAAVLAIIAGAADIPAQEAIPQTAISAQIARKVRFFAMVCGRVVAPRRIDSESPLIIPGEHERLRIDFALGWPNVSYSLVKPDEEIRVTFREGSELSIRETRKTGAKRFLLEFQQMPREPIIVLIGEGDARRTIRASTIWNLLLAEPELGRQHIIPLLELLRPNWNLASNVAALEESLFRRAAADQLPDRRRLSRLVEQLGSAKFSDRQRAERELRTAGHIVLPFLESLDRARLDAEQSDRVSNLIDELKDDREDRVDRMAVWLAGHEQTWLALMSRDEEWKRRAAADQLAALVGEKIDFNPAADANTRRKQLEHLRDLFDKPATMPAKVSVDSQDEVDDDSQ